MKTLIITCLLISGALFMLVAAVGVVRFPDLFTRMHAATKAASFGIGQIMLAVAFYFGKGWVYLEATLIIIFIFITAPVASHMIARAAYFMDIFMWKTPVDELKNRYDSKTHTLESPKVEKIRDKATK